MATTPTTEQTAQVEQPEAQFAVRKRCPLDATVLVLTEVDGIQGWLCPECEYFEPV